MGYLKIGNTEFNVDAMSEWTKEKFKQLYKGLLTQDLDLVWDAIEKERTATQKENYTDTLLKVGKSLFETKSEDIGSTGKPTKKGKKD